MDMKKYLFIIPLTPSQFLSPLREKLTDVCLHSLRAQEHDDWEAWLIGEREEQAGPLNYINAPATTKKEKLAYALDRLKASSSHPQYVIRFDDDDVVHPQGLQQVDLLTPFDLYWDAWHAQFDITSGRIRQNRITWFPNSAIHAYKHIHAEMPTGDTEHPLLVGDHSYWNHYYQGMRIAESQRESPFYVRIVTPSSHSIFNLAGKSYSLDYDHEAYERYLGSPVAWFRRSLPGYAPYFQELISFWEGQTGDSISMAPTLVDRARQFRSLLSRTLK